MDDVCTGVVPAISSIVRKLTTVGENILIQAPVYNIFYNSILNNGRHVLSSDLIYDGHEYTIDFEDLEKKLALPQTTMMILCNPHNPIGKIWSQETLKRIGDLCARHHVWLSLMKYIVILLHLVGNIFLSRVSQRPIK